jgi:hypothetical protein
VAGEAIAHVMTPRTVNAIPMANTKLAGFGAMYPSWLQYLVGTSTRPSTTGKWGEMCELLHTSLVVYQPTADTVGPSSQIWGPFPGMHEPPFTGLTCRSKARRKSATSASTCAANGQAAAAAAEEGEADHP